MIIAVTGTPGTGKTTISKAIAEIHGFRYLDVNKLIKDKEISEEYDKKRKAKVVDTKKLNKEILKEIKGGNVVIDSHLSHYLPKSKVDKCIVTKCDLKTLKKRLEKRKYSKEKIRENLDAEIFDICLVEATENKHKIIVLDTTKKVTKKILKEITK